MFNSKLPVLRTFLKVIIPTFFRSFHLRCLRTRLSNFTIFKISQIKIFIMFHNTYSNAVFTAMSGLLPSAAIVFLVVLVSSPCFALQTKGTKNITEEAPPQVVVLGRCKFHLWPKDTVWTLQEGDTIEIVAEDIGKCHEVVHLTVQMADEGHNKSRQDLLLGPNEFVTWTGGLARISDNGLVVQIHIANRGRVAALQKLISVEFPPRIEEFLPLPFQKRDIFRYFCYLWYQRQKERITGVNMRQNLGWDVGESPVLKIKVSGNPKPRVVWRVDKQEFMPGEFLGPGFVAAKETKLSSIEWLYEIELRYVTLKMSKQKLKLIARNKFSQEIKRISLPVKMFPISQQRVFVDSITESFGFLILLYIGMAVVRFGSWMCYYVARKAREDWDGVTCLLLTSLIPVRTLRKLFRLFLGFCISLGLLALFRFENTKWPFARTLFSSLFVITVTSLYGRYTRVRASFCLILVGMLSTTGMFFLLVSTVEMMIGSSHSIVKNLMERSQQVQCISQIHMELFRESMMAYISPLKKKKEEFAGFELVKERDMEMAQESMKLTTDIALNDVQGEKFGEQKESEKKNVRVDRGYKVRRFADVKKEAKGGKSDKVKTKKKFVFKSLNLCQDIGSNVLLQCLKKRNGFFNRCLSNFPKLLVKLGELICKSMVKHVDCNQMYQNTVKNFKCESPSNVNEVTEGLLLLRGGPTMFYGDASPSDLQEMYNKPIGLQFAQNKSRENKEETLRRVEEVKSIMSTVYIIVVLLLIMQSTNQVISDMMKYDMNVNWENIHIGDYFWKIDRRRKKLGLPTVHPLKRIEKQIYIQDIYRTKATLGEKEQVKLRRSLCIVIQILTIVIFLVDYLVFTMTAYEVVRENLTYSLTIDDYLKVSARGDSFFSMLMNQVFENINMDNQVIKMYRVDKCNPDVVHPNMEQYARQQALLLFLFTLTFVLPSADRLKHLVLRFYYPKREKKRQTKIYTNILLTRERFVQEAFKKIMVGRIQGRLTKIHDPHWQDLVLRQFRAISNVLSFFFKCTCSICKTSGGKNYAMCQGPGCPMIYCRQCWEVLGEKCLSCNIVITRELLEEVMH